uniref:Microfibril associated protein 2 n=1 Tax=Apteryx owenii TaxID=8824 RepID=A0A8B9PZZ2_APTOW
VPPRRAALSRKRWESPRFRWDFPGKGCSPRPPFASAPAGKPQRSGLLAAISLFPSHSWLSGTGRNSQKAKTHPKKSPRAAATSTAPSVFAPSLIPSSKPGRARVGRASAPRLSLADVTPRTPEEQFRYQSQQQSQQEIVPAPTPAAVPETEPTEPGPLDCREEQYPCTRLYSVHKPCKQCLNEICFYSLRRVYVINKEICVRTVCAHEELLRGEWVFFPRSAEPKSKASPLFYRDGGGGCF